MDLLADAGISVDLGTPTAAPPAWFWKKYPHARPVTRDGVTLGNGSRGMVSPSSPEYRRAATNITEQLARRYAPTPHWFFGMSTTSTAHLSAIPTTRIPCWRSATGSDHRYGTLDALNQAWGTLFWGQKYGEWDEIDAPGLSASVSNQCQRLDFHRFTSDAMLQCFIAERDVIKKYTPHLPVTTNFMATNCLSADYWAWAKEVDIVANDHYLVAQRTDNHVLLSMDADLTRSLAGNRPLDADGTLHGRRELAGPEHRQATRRTGPQQPVPPGPRCRRRHVLPVPGVPLRRRKVPLGHAPARRHRHAVSGVKSWTWATT